MTGEPMTDALSLLDWRRTVGELYAEVRGTPDRHSAWRRWCEVRSRLFTEHAQSPLAPVHRPGYAGPYMYGYDPAWAVTGTVATAEPRHFEIATSNEDVMAFSRVGVVRFESAGVMSSLELYWLEGYGGGLFVPFADATSGSETYGAGRYLLDTIKGADLGHENGRLRLDFNFAYQPSCAYDPRWTCPLAPPANRLSVPVRAGERFRPDPSTV